MQVSLLPTAYCLLPTAYCLLRECGRRFVAAVQLALIHGHDSYDNPVEWSAKNKVYQVGSGLLYLPNPRNICGFNMRGFESSYRSRWHE